MLFNMTKYHTKGSLKGMQTIDKMNFSSLAAAENWQESISLDRRATFLVIDIIRTSKYISN